MCRQSLQQDPVSSCTGLTLFNDSQRAPRHMGRELPRVQQQLHKVFSGGFSCCKDPISQRQFPLQAPGRGGRKLSFRNQGKEPPTAVLIECSAPRVRASGTALQMQYWSRPVLFLFFFSFIHSPTLALKCLAVCMVQAGFELTASCLKD